MTARHPALAASCLLAGVLLTGAAQDRAPVPSFPARADVTTVDVVVLDENGRPVRGLTASDFTVREDGAPQQIVAFETRELQAPRPQHPALPPARAEDEPGASHEAPGRLLAFILDDMHKDVRCAWARDAISDWLRTSADPRDRVTLATASGRVVSGTIADSRGAMLRVLEDARCGSALDSSTEEMSDFKAYQTTRSGAPIPMARYDVQPSAAVVAPNMLAQMVVDAWRRRAKRIVAAIDAFCAEHAEERGRKSVLIFTGGFIRDDDLKQAEQAIDAAQRTNTAVYFVDPRGLDPTPFSEASQGIDLAGGQQIADETGGVLVTSNDLRGSLQRVVDESSAYYLLGYVPPRPPDGKWRKLHVDVTRRGVKVRARRGYYASRTPLAASLASDSPPETASAVMARPQPGTTPPVTSPERPPLAAPPVATSAPAAAAPAAGETPALQFPARAEAVTVDVVVLDQDGRPVSGLSKDEFTLLEDGRQQPIVGFDSRELGPQPPAGEDAEQAGTSVATNEQPAATRGRTLAFVIDDLGIQPSKMIDATRALSKWLAEGADPRDEVTLATSSGQAWWSDRVGEGRQDLEAILGRLKGQRGGAGGRDMMSDYEAYSIDVQGSPMESPTEQQMQAGAPPAGNDPCANTSAARTQLDRVVNRWFVDHTCICDPMNAGASIRECRGRALTRAREVDDKARRRTAGLLASVERISRGLASSRGRKSIVILSEGFLQDADRQAFERAVDASRRGNTSVSFVDVRGLYGLSMYGADQSAALLPGDVGMAQAIARADVAGAETLADRTGGSVARDTNDLAGAVKRFADESSAYYLLGYQTDRPFDGRWRKLQVKVSRPGLSVRARRGYYAMAEPLPLAVPAKDKKADKRNEKNGGKKEALPVRALDPALAVGGQRDEIPIRMAPHVFEADAAGRVRVLVALEVDTAALGFAASGSRGPRKAKLDVTVVGVSRDQPVVVPLDSSVELSLEQETPGGWWIFSRELKLPPGPAQLRALVRDAATGHAGLVAQRLDIPSPAAPYLSTPILTNLLSKNAAGPKIVPVAHRAFAPRGSLFCAFEVYVAPGRDLTAVPDVRSSYMLSDDSGRVVSEELPTAVAVALGGGVARTLVLPLARLAPGRYQLAIQATDPKLGVDLHWSGTFVVEPAAGPDTAAGRAGAPVAAEGTP